MMGVAFDQARLTWVDCHGTGISIYRNCLTKLARSYRLHAMERILEARKAVRWRLSVLPPVDPPAPTSSSALAAEGWGWSVRFRERQW